MTRNTITTVLELVGFVLFVHGIYTTFGYGAAAMVAGVGCAAVGYLEGK